MDQLSLILKKIKNKPTAYLGKPTINCLYAFLAGYKLCQIEQQGLSAIQQPSILDGFQIWIQEKFDIKSSQSWANIILLFSQDEQDALKSFFELFDQFQIENPLAEAELIGNIKNQNKNTTPFPPSNL